MTYLEACGVVVLFLLGLAVLRRIIGGWWKLLNRLVEKQPVLARLYLFVTVTGVLAAVLWFVVQIFSQ